MRRREIRASLAAVVGAAMVLAGCRSKTPEGLHPNDTVVGYLTAMSFIGGSGSIVLDDGQAFSIDMTLGAKAHRLSPEELGKLVDTVATATSEGSFPN